MSMEEDMLPGVLPERAGLTVLTLVLGSFRVVTVLRASSPIGESMPAARSEVESTDGRLVWRIGELEKKRGENKDSRIARTDALVRGAVATAGISNLLGGDAPVRGFLGGAEAIMELSEAGREARLPMEYNGDATAADAG